MDSPFESLFIPLIFCIQMAACQDHPEASEIYSVLCVKRISALALNASQTAHISERARSNCGICAYS